MRVARFRDEYAETAPLYDRSPEELRARDAAQGQPLQRWLASSDDQIVAAVSTWLRPDDRLFLYFVGAPMAYSPLSDAVVGELGRSVHTMADDAQVESLAALTAAGFSVEMSAERFRIPFDQALAWLRRARVPAGFAIESAADVEVERLFELDNELRRDTPGTDGWVGDLDWFREELLEAPPFDRNAYLVGVDVQTGRYAGLCRIWRNPSGPRFGLIGIARPYRRTTLAAALIRRSLEAAATWGHDSFVTESSLSNRVIHPRLKRLATTSEGVFHQLVKRAS